MVEHYVRFDEYEDVLVSTDLLAFVASKLQEQPSNWKWMIIAAQSSVQGALVCAIKNTSATNILRESSAKKRLKWLDTLTGPAPPEQLDDFIPLLKKYRKMYPCCGTIQQLRQLRELHREFRNSFIHFVPGNWSISISSLPPMIESALILIEAAMQQHQVAIHFNEDMQSRLGQNLRTTRAALAALDIPRCM
jgi:hypothetical protein